MKITVSYLVLGGGVPKRSTRRPMAVLQVGCSIGSIVIIVIIVIFVIVVIIIKL